jgi:GH35 family endo-1,4-beta-xylanase
MLATAPAFSQSLTIQAQDASIKTAGAKIETPDKSQGGWNIYSEGDLGDYVQFPADGTYKVVVRAHGSVAKGVWPLMALNLNSRQIAVVTVPKEPFEDYSFDLTVTQGTSRLVVSFLNDASVPDPKHPNGPPWLEDRNLYVNRIVISPPPGGQAPTLGKAQDAARTAVREEDEILKQTGSQIDSIRKADAIVEVDDASGKPVAGAKVRAELVRHEFLFGCNCFMFDRFGTPADNELYKRRFAELFNYATLPFYWRWYEPKPGQPDYAYTDKVVAWCAEHNIRMKGHPILWGCEAGTPTWSKGQPDEATQKKRVRDILGRYGGKIEFWEIVNEPAHLDAIRIDQPYRWAREADPKGQLIVNDFNVLGSGCPAFFDLLTKAKAGGVPFEGVGIQAHEPRFSRFPLDQVQRVLDHYATLGKDLYITEFTPTSGGQAIVGSAIGGKWDEAVQADYAVKFYRVCFAHASVKGIVWWDLCEQGSWLDGGGMLRKDLSPKPVYDALKKLIHHEWHTDAQGQTDANGHFAFRGFRGAYELTVTVGGKTVTTPMELGKNGCKPDACKVKLP